MERFNGEVRDREKVVRRLDRSIREVGSSRIRKRMKDVPGITEIEAFLKAIEVWDAAAIRSPYSDAIRTLYPVVAAIRSLETERMEEVV